MLEAEIKKLSLAYNAFRRPKIQRDTCDVLGEYNAEWSAFHGQLEQCSTFQEWLDADWAEPAWCNIEDNMVCTTLNVGDYNRGVLADAIRKNFPRCQIDIGVRLRRRTQPPLSEAGHAGDGSLWL